MAALAWTIIICGVNSVLSGHSSKKVNVGYKLQINKLLVDEISRLRVCSAQFCHIGIMLEPQIFRCRTRSDLLLTLLVEDQIYLLEPFPLPPPRLRVRSWSTRRLGVGVAIPERLRQQKCRTRWVPGAWTTVYVREPGTSCSSICWLPSDSEEEVVVSRRTRNSDVMLVTLQPPFLEHIFLATVYLINQLQYLNSSCNLPYKVWASILIKTSTHKSM